MGNDSVLTMTIAIAGVVGAFFEGRRRGSSVEMGIATDTVELLQAKVELLTEDREHRDAIIADLQIRVEMLESLVTQRAEVETVKIEVQGVRGVVDRIAAKVGA